MNKYSLWAVIIGGVTSILVLLFLMWWMFFRVSYIVYAEDTVIEGGFVITEEQPVLLKNNAKLTIKGDAVLAGELTCKNGAIQLEVDGFLSLANQINCDEDPAEVENSGVIIIAKGGLMMGRDAVIESEGSVQILDTSSKVANSQEAVDKLFDAVETQEDGIQVGPLTNAVADQDFVQEVSLPVSKSKVLPFVDVAHAQEEVEGGQVDLKKLAERIEKANLTPEEKEALNLIASALVNELFGGDGRLSKNHPSIMQIDRLLRDSSDAEEKAWLGLQYTQKEFDELSWLVDQFLEEGKTKRPVILAGTIRIGSGERPPEEVDLEKLLKDKFEEERKRPKKVILNFDFSEGRRGVSLNNLTIKGPQIDQ